jgi:PLP dependent protein
MNNIAANIAAIKSQLPEEVTLVAVSKTKPVSDLLLAYEAGQRAFGENKVQEMTEKAQQLPDDIQWHMIGHLQTNKVKYIAPFVHLIHSVDSLKLLREIDKEGKKNGRVIACLLQMHIASEESKFGMDFNELKELLESREFVEMHNISINGLMGMASFTDDESKVREEFRELSNMFHTVKSHYFRFNSAFRELSMGMSGDYGIAVEEGSTMIRTGSSIFGGR